MSDENLHLINQLDYASEPPAERRRRGLLIGVPATLLGVALAVMTLLFRPYILPSASMAPTLMKGDYFFVVTSRAAERGDVIVFRPAGGDSTTFVKRVIAVSGDRVQMRGGRLHLNGLPVQTVVEGTGEVGLCWNGSQVQRVREALPGGRSYMTYDCGPRGDVDDTAVFAVPEGSLFVMGDNRDNSLDSRVPQAESGLGFIPAENVVGKAAIILLSWRDGPKFDRALKKVQ